MYLIVGLGNPGTEYERTRHNAGFMVLDEFARRHDFPEFVFLKKHSSLLSEGTLGRTKVLLAKPQTFMNSSGKAVRSLMAVRPALILIHDEIDLPLGEVRVSRARGSAGHKGVESVMQELKTKDFSRIRVGVRPKTGKPARTEQFVLKPFTKEEAHGLSGVLSAAADRLDALLEES
ncbi:MAG: aminoacyl-tRNA hydrolase [bacterium]|nr:aminoacyl-tRNA hydrolase [bacterium]